MKKGFSFSVLVATVIIMVILLTSITFAGNSTIENSKKLTFATELSMLQQAVDGYSKKNNGMYPIKSNIVLDVSNLNENTIMQFDLNKEEIVNNKVILNEIDYDKIMISTLKYGNAQDGENDIYAISPNTGKVYYAKGMKIDNKLYFTLTEDLNNSLSSNAKSQNAKKSTNNLVIFAPSETSWTKNDVSVDVKIPNTCELNNIYVDGDVVSDYTVTQAYGYNVYTILEEGNYSIQVKYHKKDDVNNIINATYNVNNIDKMSPNLDIEPKPIYLESSEEIDLLGYIKVLEKKDSLSGIKYCKYESNSIYSKNITEEEKVNVKEHFENNGNKIIGDIIPIEKGNRTITIYLEDNAGNWILQNVNVEPN